ncbi:MAG: ankyrin repeat domain-containing protein [Bryobacteraceae bacterium]
MTPLHWAAQGGWIDAAQALLDCGADKSAKDSQHNGVPLDWARFFEQKEMIELLSR